MSVQDLSLQNDESATVDSPAPRSRVIDDNRRLRQEMHRLVFELRDLVAGLNSALANSRGNGRPDSRVVPVLAPNTEE